MTMVVVHLGDRYLTCFMQNLATGSDQKMAKTKTVQKTKHMWHLGPKG